MKDGPPFLRPDVCIYCNIPILPFSITPVMESESGTYFHQMCEKCADENHPGWREDEEDED